jgi:type 1 glutamine amidotransferase
MRDMTDSMYNHRKRPWVSHFRGTELVVEHIEQYWCPSVTSAEFLGGEPFRFKGHVTKKIVLIIGEDEYSTWETLPEFAHKELEWRGYDVSAVLATHIATAPNANTFANFEAIRDADAIVVSVRRRTPQKAMMDLVRAHVAAGKPVVGLRTANHAFQAGPPSADFAAWNDFDTAVLGGHYAGHYNNKPPAAPHSVIEIVQSNAVHPVLYGVKTGPFRVTSHLYKCRGLASSTVPLLQGRVEGQNTVEPVAWVHETDDRRVFYTSLGNADDFNLPVFRRMLLNGILWSLNDPVPPAEFDMAAAGAIAPSPPAAAPAPEASPKAENRSE